MPVKPWALELAERCLDMRSGRFLFLPFSGGMVEQDERIMRAIEAAWYVWFLAEFKPQNNQGLSPEEQQYMAWVTDESDK